MHLNLIIGYLNKALALLIFSCLLIVSYFIEFSTTQTKWCLSDPNRHSFLYHKKMRSFWQSNLFSTKLKHQKASGKSLQLWWENLLVQPIFCDWQRRELSAQEVEVAVVSQSLILNSWSSCLRDRDLFIHPSLCPVSAAVPSVLLISLIVIYLY